MVQRAVKREQTVLDPMFNIPAGVDELTYNDDVTLDVVSDDPENVSAFEDNTSEFDYDVDLEDAGESNDVDYSDAPETPQILAVVPPQLIRMSDSGAEVVDVVLEVDDVYGVSKYEFRVTKL